MANAFTLFGEISADTSKLQQGLDKVESQLQTTKKFMEQTEQAGRELGLTSAQTGRHFEKLNEKLSWAKDRVQQLNQQYTAGQITSQQYARGLEAVDRAVKSVSDKVKDGSAKMEDYAVKTKKAAEAMKAAEASANSMEKQIGDVSSKLTAVGGGMMEVGAGLTASLTLPITAAGYAIATAGMEFEDALLMIQGVSGATGEQMERLSDLASQLGNDMALPGTSAKTASQAMLALMKAGMGVDETMNSVRGTIMLAKAAQIEEAQAAEITANALNTFSLAASESERVADLLAATANSSAQGIVDVAEAAKYASPAFAQAGQPIEDMTTALALLANAGMKGSMAGTGLRQMMANLQTPTGASAKAIKQLGIEMFDAEGNMKSMPNIIDQFNKAMTGMTDEEKVTVLSKIFDRTTLGIAQTLFKEGAAGFDTMKKKVTEVGAAAKLSAAMTSGLSGIWEAIGSQLETIGLELFKAVKEPIKQALTALGSVLGVIGDAFASMPQGFKIAIVAIAALVAAIGPVLVIGAALLTWAGFLLPVITGIATAITTAGGAFAALAAALAPIKAAIAVSLAPLLPILLKIGLVVAGLIAVGVLLYKAWNSNFMGIRDTIVSVVAVLKGLFLKAFNSVKDAIGKGLKAMNEFWEENKDAVKSAITNLVKLFAPAIAQVTATIKMLFNIFVGVFSAIWDYLKSWVTGMWNIVKGLVNILIGIFTLDLEKIGDGVMQIFSGLVTIAKAQLKLLWDTVKVFITEIFNYPINYAKSLLGTYFNVGSDTIDGFVDGMVDAVPGLRTVVDFFSSETDKAIDEASATTREGVSNYFNEVGESVEDGNDTVVDLVNAKGKQLQKALTDLANNTQLSEEFRKAAAENAKAVGEAYEKGLDEAQKKARAGMEGLIKTLTDIIQNPLVSEEFREAAKKQIKAFQDELNKGSEPVKKTISEAVKPANDEADKARKNGASIGMAILQGLKYGILGNLFIARDAGSQVGREATKGAKDALQSKSPSKVFMQIGKDTVQGFLDGVNQMKSIFGASMSAFFDVTMLSKQLKGKTGEAVLQWYTSLIGNQTQLATKTEEAKLQLMFQTEAFKNLGEDVKTAMIQFARWVDLTAVMEENTKKNTEKVNELKDAVKALEDTFIPAETELQKMTRLLSDTAVLEAYAASIGKSAEEARKYALELARVRDLLDALAKAHKTPADYDSVLPGQEGTAPKRGGVVTIPEDGGGLFPMPPTSQWEDFFEKLEGRLAQMREELPSFSEGLVNVFQMALEGVGDIFANAVREWDGTWKGFWTSLKKGFANLVREIAAYLVKLLVMHAVMTALSAGFGALAKGNPNSTFGQLANAVKPGTVVAKASGGLVTGRGSGTSDSIAAMLSNGEYVIPAKAVRKFGVGFFDQIRNMQMPSQLAVAGTGNMMPPVSSVSNTSNVSTMTNTFNINVPQGTPGQKTGSMIQKDIIMALKKTERRNR